MAAPRLPFLWPMLYRAAECQPRVRSTKTAAQFRAFYRASGRRQQETVAQRYGSANEPPPHLAGAKGSGKAKSAKQIADKPKSLPKIAERVPANGEQVARKADPTNTAADPTTVDTNTTPASIGETKSTSTTADSANEADHDTSKSTIETKPPDEKPVESLLDSIPNPAQKDPKASGNDDSSSNGAASTSESQTPAVSLPHLEPPRHVHHFDTYGLVKRLNDGGFNEQQAVTLMKAMRLQLAQNMDLANQALVSKSMVENETYLFRAACAELKTEVTSRRRGEQEKMRTERTQLQHEVDILSQRMGQEIAGLKDELKGMFDDRKMSVRNEQRSMESRLQQINYKITVALQADAKSDVEGLRWVMTRRVIIALAAVIFMVVGSLKLYSNSLHENELDAKRRANSKSGGTQTDDTGSPTAKDVGTASDVLVKVNEGDNPSFVSLG